MRAGLALIAALALTVTPAVAQGKTKAPATPESVQMLEVCEKFATDDAAAVDDAIAKGWDAYSQEGESPYVRSFAGSRDIPGIGLGELFVLLEDYPSAAVGYCRIDVMEPAGDGQVHVQAIQNLDRYEGEGLQTGAGSFASLTGRDDKSRMLLAHWAPDAFVVQLTIVTPKAETAE